MKKWLPDWVRYYQRDWLPADLVAGVIVAIATLPQSLAYAMLAGMPPEAGLYAAMLPVVVYALTGSSMSLAVGPVAIMALMVSSVLHPLAPVASPQYVTMAIHLSLMSGVILLLFSVLRLGFLANFMSHPVISGFITGSAVLIAVSQIKTLLGLDVAEGGLVATLLHLAQALPNTNFVTASIGGVSIVVLLWMRRRLAGILERLGVSTQIAALTARTAPVVVVVVASVIVAMFDMDTRYGVRVVGVVPDGLPHLSLSLPGWQDVKVLWLPAVLIALIGFVESISLAQSFAMKRQERVVPDKELFGLGAANLASALTGSFPIAGGFSRSSVNLGAGTKTQLTGIVAAIGTVFISLWLTGMFYYLPVTVLSAIIIVAVLSLLDIKTLKEAWHYDRADACSLLVTICGVLFLGVESGILIGVALSLGVLVWRSSHPHMAVVGRLEGTEHFRNVLRHEVETLPELLALRVDESLYFANSAIVERHVESLLLTRPQTRYLLLICSAVNLVDATALGVLTQMRSNLQARGITFLMAEVKGPIMDRLRKTELGEEMEGRIFLSANEAYEYVQAQLRLTA